MFAVWCLASSEPYRLLQLWHSLGKNTGVTHQGPLSMGFPRQEYCSGLPFPSPGIFRDRTSVLCGSKWFFSTRPTWKSRTKVCLANSMSFLRQGCLMEFSVVMFYVSVFQSGSHSTGGFWALEMTSVLLRISVVFFFKYVFIYGCAGSLLLRFL